MPRDASQGGPNDRERLQHMLDAARDVRVFVRNRTRDDMDSDAMLRRALVHALQEIGEAAARMGDEGRRRVPTLPWGQIVAARNILVHVYWGIDADLVWKMAAEDIPSLIATIEPVLSRWPMPDVSGPNS